MTERRLEPTGHTQRWLLLITLAVFPVFLAILMFVTGFWFGGTVTAVATVGVLVALASVMRRRTYVVTPDYLREVGWFTRGRRWKPGDIGSVEVAEADVTQLALPTAVVVLVPHEGDMVRLRFLEWFLWTDGGNRAAAARDVIREVWGLEPLPWGEPAD